MIKLRDYQQNLLKRIRAALRADPVARIMVQLPTGGGKTYIAGELLARLLKGRKAVWLTHRKELAEQTKGMLSGSGVSAVTNVVWQSRDTAPTVTNGVMILMAQTVSRRLESGDVWSSYGSKDIMIIDEAHHATAEGYAKAIELWPGPVIGLTATPWRLSRREGFEHLFRQLICGPQIAELQQDGYLCSVKTLVPAEEGRVSGGDVGAMEDYTESGIASANAGSQVWTAGAVDYWKKHGKDRPTIVYAVSVEHADNLLRLFLAANVPAEKILGTTPDAAKQLIIRRFRAGHVKVIVNVLVATEGFDLPDASCILITRPTLSLALYLQMVGRGMRPKDNGGDCLVLDVAGNSLRHGLPEENREWSLQRRSDDVGVGFPSQRCPYCDHVSASASHECQNCGEPFGEDCPRCGRWRVWAEWSLLEHCEEDHQRVCDYCHNDAHVMANLPPLTDGIIEMDGPLLDLVLGPNRNPFLRDILEEERLLATGQKPGRARELRDLIEKRESVLADDDLLWDAYEEDLRQSEMDPDTLSQVEKARLYAGWESIFKQELDEWRSELARLLALPVDEELVYKNATERVLKLLEAEAKVAGLLPDTAIPPVAREQQPAPPPPVSTSAPKGTPKRSSSNRGYRYPGTSEVWKLEDAFFAVASEEQKQTDVANKTNPYSNSNAKQYNFRRKVVLAAGFIPNKA